MSSASDTPDITLQINLCAGDLAYGERIVSALVAAHRDDIREILIVADGCRPQSTPLLHAPSRFPPDEFAARLAKLRDLCAALEASKQVDRVVWLEPDAARLRPLNAKYAGVATAASHDHLGHAFSAYFLGWEAARTRYVAHFDADIFIWQAPGFRWLRAAVAALAADERFLAASPRIAPPLADGRMVDVAAPGSGWLPSWPLETCAAGWESPWFSTRCHVMDRERLARVLPLRGRRPKRRDAAINQVLSPLFEQPGFSAAPPGTLGRKLAARVPPFPLPPEVLLHQDAETRGFRCLYLGDPRAWFVHPDTKPERFPRLLPRLLRGVNERGVFPPSQRGVSGVQFGAWEEFTS
ncbi:MAG TPA: hypothetical protein VM029_00705 [Opitutaceae bacterium]|nr:hypothetical protein [Opitutaceae bacterium]